MMLSSYQETIRFLLKQNDYPEVSAVSFDTFKQHFQSSAFTCRLKFCPRATTDFKSEKLRRQHEIGHTTMCICSKPECESHLFVSRETLEEHRKKAHSPKRLYKPIRPERHVPYQALNKDTGADLESVSSSTLNIPSEYYYTANAPPAKNPNYLNAQNSPRDRSKDSVMKRKIMHDVGSLDHADSAATTSTPPDPIPDSYYGSSPEVGVLDPLQVQSEYRNCKMQGCRDRVRSNELQDHYWNQHHSDSIAQCAMESCWMTFSNRELLQQHYEEAHTTVLGHDGPHDDDTDTDDEPRLGMAARQWFCSALEPGSLGQDSADLLNIVPGNCESCITGQKYDDFSDAVHHVRTVHFKDFKDDRLDGSHSDLWKKYVREVPQDRFQPLGYQTSQKDVESPDDRSDDVFYVEGLS